jgi:hypothetical protein
VKLTTIQGLAEWHRAVILDEEEVEDTTQDIQVMFSDTVKVSFNRVGVNESNDVRRGAKRSAAEPQKGRWCLICK